MPASPMAPLHLYGTAAKGKDQQVAVASYCDRFLAQPFAPEAEDHLNIHAPTPCTP
ncbi:hypothetical protein [Streptomyces longwoodensis]|uniref:hypothetical protein n=1 Tax=Streptomyces longwoodensis TaxID=68231 RepID=UPI0033E45B72